VIWAIFLHLVAEGEGEEKGEKKEEEVMEQRERGSREHYGAG